MDAIMPLPLSDEDVRAQHVCESFLRRACGAPLCSAVDATLSSAADAPLQQEVPLDCGLIVLHSVWLAAAKGKKRGDLLFTKGTRHRPV